MPSLPITLISSLVLTFLLVQMWLTDRRHGPIVALLAICALQGLIISLAQHYLVPGVGVLQPIVATTIPPMAWVAFQATAVRRFRKRDLLSFAPTAIAILSLFVFPDILDILIPALFVGFGGLLLWQSMQGSDALPRMRIEAGDLPGRIWQIIGVALILSAFTDVLIVGMQVSGVGHLRVWVISIYSSLMLLVIGGLSLSGALTNAPIEGEETRTPEISEKDTQIVARLDDLLTTEELYLNPDLTLSQLSCKLRIPAKQLSGAINRVKGENVSRTINALRIQAAQKALLSGESVTNAMLGSGFNTKSNFNREFLRVTGKSPREWFEAQA